MYSADRHRARHGRHRQHEKRNRKRNEAGICIITSKIGHNGAHSRALMGFMDIIIYHWARHAPKPVYFAQFSRGCSEVKGTRAVRPTSVPSLVMTAGYVVGVGGVVQRMVGWLGLVSH